MASSNNAIIFLSIFVEAKNISDFCFKLIIFLCAEHFFSADQVCYNILLFCIIAYYDSFLFYDFRSYDQECSWRCDAQSNVVLGCFFGCVNFNARLIFFAAPKLHLKSIIRNMICMQKKPSFLFGDSLLNAFQEF